MSDDAIKRIKSLQKAVINKASIHPLHSEEVVKISQEIDKFVIIAMKDINKTVIKI